MLLATKCCKGTSIASKVCDDVFWKAKVHRKHSKLDYQQNKLNHLLDHEGRIDTDKLLADSSFSLGGMAVFLTSLGGSLQFGLASQLEKNKREHGLSFNGYTMLGSRFAKIAVEIMFKHCKSEDNSPAELRLTDCSQLKTLQIEPLITFVVYDETGWTQSQMRDLFLNKSQWFHKPMIVFSFKRPIEFVSGDSLAQTPFGFGRFCKVDRLSLEYNVAV